MRICCPIFHSLSFSFIICVLTFKNNSGIYNLANWAQLAGERAQNAATSHVPDEWHRDRGNSVRPMWSARFGHAVVVLDEPTARSYLTEEENSDLLRDAKPVLVLLGGDDGLSRGTWNSLLVYFD